MLIIIYLIFSVKIKVIIRGIDKKIKKDKKPEKPKNVEVYEKQNPNIPPHMLHFISGQQNAWNLTRLAIYKMYIDGDLLNYESMVEGMQKRLMTFNDQKIVNSIAAQLDIYTKKLISEKTTASGDQCEGKPGCPPVNGPDYPAIEPPQPPDCKD